MIGKSSYLQFIVVSAAAAAAAVVVVVIVVCYYYSKTDLLLLYVYGNCVEIKCFLKEKRIEIL